MMKADRMIIFRGGIFMKCYVVDAFTKEVFKGNPAAVCVLDSWLPDALMQAIAIENNLSETEIGRASCRERV